jgi:hypothetical protein
MISTYLHSSKKKLPPATPQAETTPQIVNTLRAKGIHAKQASTKDSNVFICANRNLTYIERATKSLPEHEKKELGHFFYCPIERAICCDLSRTYGIEYPEGTQLSYLLKISRNQQIEEHPPLPLSNGTHYSEKTFTQDPLFRNTLEKHSVFRELYRLLSNPSFQEDYQNFLDIIQSNNPKWAEAYRFDPIGLAYLSLFAYLDGNLTKEELFIAHMLASAFLESPQSASYVVLSQENARNYLQYYNYLTEQNISQDFYCLRNLDRKSTLAKTTISYESKERGDLAAYTTITSRGGQNPPGVRYTQNNKRHPSVSICFLPPWLWKRLYAELNPKHSPPIEHEELFGFRCKIDDIISGRPISYASPLFYLPNAHRLKGTQLSVTAHDILYHCLLDWLHPHANDLIKLGQKTRSIGQTSLELAINIMDRPFIGLSSDPVINIADHIKKYAPYIKKLPEKDQATFFIHCKEVFGEPVIENIFSTTLFEQKFRP